MTKYKRNKLKTVCQIISRIENWPTALDLRLWRHRPGLRLLQFRDGLMLACRRDTRDWDVVHELLFAGGYGRAIRWLKDRPGRPIVLDLGGNIGLFSLLAARAHPTAEIYAFEPGPPNFRLFEINRLANEALADRIHLRKEAVAGTTRRTEWFFDALNPGGSSLFGKSGMGLPVQITAFEEVIQAMPENPELVKIDIEGAEFEMIARTPPKVWQRINAVALELHDDPEGKISREEFMAKMKSYGFIVEEETVISYFLHRKK